MRTLFLLRHAKSSWDDPDLGDYDRPLAHRGRKAAAAMGVAMAERGWLPDLALVSPALRARDTWERLAAELPAPVETRFETAIYMASPDDLLGLLRAAPETARTVLLVGHNPGLEDCAGLLAGPGSDPEARSRLAEKFPTAALARFDIPPGPTGLQPGGAALTDFLRPRDLAS